MKSKKSPKTPENTSKRIARLERTVARHERELRELREIIDRAEVLATITANGVRALVEKLAPSGNASGSSSSASPKKSK